MGLKSFLFSTVLVVLLLGPAKTVIFNAPVIVIGSTKHAQ